MIEIQVIDDASGIKVFTVKANTREQAWIEVKEAMKRLKVQMPNYIIINHS